MGGLTDCLIIITHFTLIIRATDAKEGEQRREGEIAGGRKTRGVKWPVVSEEGVGWVRGG